MVCAQFRPVMISAPVPSPVIATSAGRDMAALVDCLAKVSSRPRYAYILLGLLAEIAGPDGSAGPYVGTDQGPLPLRDWLCDALAPMGQRDPRRLTLTERVREELTKEGQLPEEPAAASRMVDAEVRDRIRTSGKTNLSRAISELVKAGLIRRHYKGYAVDHINRGGQRLAVYTLIGRTRCLLASTPLRASPRQQLSLGF
jgi:hypothetical protein